MIHVTPTKYNEKIKQAYYKQWTSRNAVHNDLCYINEHSELVRTKNNTPITYNIISNVACHDLFVRYCKLNKTDCGVNASDWLNETRIYITGRHTSIT